ncbi:MFS transporter [Streptomyces sp. NBUL23]|uniref:MFS transporter n=1 Tax=Streptomyces sp. NBUL23 TaxID=3381354 RepID=UPI00387275E6
MTEAVRSEAQAGTGRPGFRALLGPGPFRRFFLSRAVSLTGDAAVPIALALSLSQPGQSAGWLGAMLAAAIIPKVLLMAFGGIAADRLPKLALMLGSSLVCGVAQLATAVLIASQTDLRWALLAQTCYGISTAVGYPATFGYLPHVTGPERLGPANALLGAWTGVAGVLGPAITSVLALAMDPVYALALDGVSFFVAAALLLGLPRGGTSERTAKGGPAALRDGWSALRQLPWLLRMTLLDGSLMLLVTGPFLVLGPALVARSSPHGWAAMMLCFAAGELIGSLLSGRLHPSRPILLAALGLLTLGLPPLLLAGGAGLVVLCVAQMLAGAGIGAYGVLITTAVQASVSPEKLARVGALTSIGSFGFLPLGYLLAPLLATLVDPLDLMWGAAGWTVVAVLGLVANRDLRAFGSSLQKQVPSRPTSPSDPEGRPC